MSPAGSSYLLGVRIDRVIWDDILKFCRQALKGTRPKQIATVNGEFILIADHNPAYKDVLNRSDLNIPDSTNVYWISILKGQALPMITPGSDFTLKLAELAAETGDSIFLLGGRGEVPKKAATELKRRHPNVKIAGTSSGNPHDPAVIKHIQTAKPDIVLIAYGAPTQDFWIAEHKSKLTARILVGVGGTFDMLAGVLPRAPHSLRALHLEWLWRLIIEPRRLGRILNAVIVFPLKALFN